MDTSNKPQNKTFKVITFLIGTVTLIIAVAFSPFSKRNAFDQNKYLYQDVMDSDLYRMFFKYERFGDKLISYKYPYDWDLVDLVYFDLDREISTVNIYPPNLNRDYYINFSFNNPSDVKSKVWVNDSCSSLKIDDKNARRCSYPKDSDDETSSVYTDSVFIYLDGGIYVIEAVATDKGTLDNFKPVFEKVISSVKSKM